MSDSLAAAAPEIRSLSTLLADLKGELRGDTISVGELADALHERGIAMLLLLFAAPMALPVPVPPGINIALASPLILLTWQQAMGAHTIWLPEKLRSRRLGCAKFARVIDGIIPWMRRIEVLVKPRAGWITQDGASRLFGFLGLLMALTVCIPLPLTNTVPSMGIVFMAIGFIMRDGLAVIVGALTGMGWISMLVTAILIFGTEAFDIVRQMFHSVF